MWPRMAKGGPFAPGTPRLSIRYCVPAMQAPVGTADRRSGPCAGRTGGSATGTRFSLPHPSICAPGVDRMISSSASSISAGIVSNKGVER